MYTSFETANSILQDLKMNQKDGFKGVLNSSNIDSKYVSWDQWCEIDQMEIGKGLGKKPREKFGTVREMIEFIK
jgi:hypothetical protein